MKASTEERECHLLFIYYSYLYIFNYLPLEVEYILIAGLNYLKINSCHKLFVNELTNPLSLPWLHFKSTIRDKYIKINKQNLTAVVTALYPSLKRLAVAVHCARGRKAREEARKEQELPAPGHGSSGDSTRITSKAEGK